MKQHHSRWTRLRKWLAGTAAAALTATAAVGGVAASAVPAQAAPPVNSSCSYATPGSGEFANSICWFDMGALTGGADAPIPLNDDVPMTVALPGGYTISYTLRASSVSASGGGLNVRARAFPTWPQAYFGNAQQGPGSAPVYSGIQGKPAIYQIDRHQTTTVQLSNISMRDKDGQPVTQFSLVGVDAETTDVRESITWSSDKPLTSLTQNGADNGLGNACAAGFTGVGTTQVSCLGTGGDGGTEGLKTGAAMLAANAPSTFTTVIKADGGWQGMAFGVLTSTVELAKEVPSGVNGDIFNVNIASNTGAPVAHAVTPAVSGGAVSGVTTTGPQVIIADAASGSDFVFSESPGAGTDMNHYDKAWSCTRSDQPDTSIQPDATGQSANVNVKFGQSVKCTITNTLKPSKLTLLKEVGAIEDVNGNGLTDAGDKVTYKFTVTNNGSVALAAISVADPKLGAIACPPVTLAPGESTTACVAAAPYTLTAADQSAGTFENTATASAKVGNTNGEPISSDPSTATVDLVAPGPGLKIVKSAAWPGSPTAKAKLGDVVTYTFTVSNTGNVPLSNIVVSDGAPAFSGVGTLSPINCNNVTSLAVNADFTCTATYTVQQGDVDKGSITNVATASGSTGTTTVPPVPSDPVVVPTDASSSLALVKTASRADATKPGTVGEVINYSFAVSNTGTTTIRNLSINEVSFSGTGTLSTPVCDTTTLNPKGQTGDSTTCTATYTVTQADVDAGSLDNVATATGADNTTTPVVSNESPAKVTLPAAPKLELVKSADLGDGVSVITEAGQSVNYTFKVTNTGNVTLTNVKVAEGDFNGTGTFPPLDCTIASLAPGASDSSCTVTYTVTAADVAHPGSLTNTATATGTTPGGETVPSDPSEVTVPVDPPTTLNLVKGTDGTTIRKAGDVINYTFAVTNTGQSVLDSISIDESGFGGAEPKNLSATVCPLAELPLAPGKTITCTASYTVTQADVDKGIVPNVATATGKSGDKVTPPSSSTVDVPINSDPSLALTKTNDVTGKATLGQKVTYSFLVENKGNVTLTNIKVNEGSFTGTGELSAIDCPDAASLAPGASITCTATYTVTQADVDAGGVVNSAVAQGNKGDTPVTSQPSTSTFLTEQTPGLSLTKVADTKLVTKPGQKITYTFTAKNTGNVTLTDVHVNEGDFTGTGALPALDCVVASLAPGAEHSCTLEYVATAEDVLKNKPISNTATVAGTPPTPSVPTDPEHPTEPSKPITSDPSTSVVPVDPETGITVVKKASVSKVTKVGESIVYTFTVTNTGFAPIQKVSIAETSFTGKGQPPVATCPAAPLAPGASIECRATYTVVAADLSGADIDNTAIAKGVSHGKDLTSDPSSAKVTTVKPAVPGTPETPAEPGKPNLPDTGANTGLFAAAGAGTLALMVGGALLLISRRRKAAE